MEDRTDAAMAKATPTGNLRWRYREPSEGSPGRELQQEFETVEYYMHKVSGRTTEWRDVPTI